MDETATAPEPAPLERTRTADVLGDGALVLHQYELGCLSQLSYLVADRTTGRAVVIDPRRDVREYLTDAADEGLRIELVIETHFHADFLSGHLELADATGAEIAFGEGAETEFASRRLADGEQIVLGEVVLEVRATPGHTPESISVVAFDHSRGSEPVAAMTGDTLFIGDVGRPDLLASSGVTAEDLAARLHRSLHDKLLTLPDETFVLPAHGAGSACGKALSTATVSTVGEQRRTNYALAPMSVDRFVEVVTEGQRSAPAYFGFDAALNRSERALLNEEPSRALDLDAVRSAQRAGAVVLDTRDPPEFAAGHLRGSVNVGLGGRFAEIAGTVLSPERDIVLVTEPGTEAEAKVRLARIGFDRTLGHLVDPLDVLARRPDLVEHGSRLSAAELAATGPEAVQLVDVREPSEVAGGMHPDARHLPLGQLAQRSDELDPKLPTVVYCAGGYRSSVAASLLRAQGFVDVSDVLGGWGAIEAA